MVITSDQREEILSLEEKVRRIDAKMFRIERSYIGFKDVMSGISGHISTMEAEREFKKVLRKRIEEGRVIPVGTEDHLMWSTLYNEYKRLEDELHRKRDEFLLKRFGFVPMEGDPLTMFTSSFLHVGIFSIIANLFFLSIVGPLLEDRWGHYFLLLVYLGGGILGSFLHWIMVPQGEIPSAGGSSSVGTILGVYAATCPKERIRLIFPFSSTFLIILWFIQLLYQPFLEPVQIVRGHGIIAGVSSFGLGVLIGIQRTGRLTRLGKEAFSPYHKMVKRANEYFELGQFDRARRLFEKATKMDPKGIEAHLGLARAYRKEALHKEAILEYNQAIEIAIKESSNVLAIYDEFQEAYPGVILEPGNQFRVAKIMEKSGRYDEAFKMYRAIFTIHIGHELAPRALHSIGRLYMKLNQPKEAIETFEEVLRLFPNLRWKEQILEDIQKAGSLVI